MASVLNPYLNFDGNARQALEFYKEIFGGELKLNTYGEYGDKNAPEANNVMHGQLETTSGYTLMGADNPPGAEHKPGNNITISLSGEDGDELRGYWETLSSGGMIILPLEKQMWGDEFGMCADKFGIPWMVNITQPKG
jgi:PhnB protein